MRPNFDTAVKHEGTLGLKRIPFTVDVSTEAAVAHLMDMLTDTYSDPVAAAIREPATNAQDSHIAAGQIRPIEVSLPTDIDPTFTVRDFGVGMSLDDVTLNYTKFLYSTKRENDDEAGMFGIGCKAPLTYVSQFTLIAVKDGVKVTVLVSRGEDGKGGLEPVDVRKTKESDGVEVTIPVNSSRELFIAEARKFFSFWSKGSVLVDGKPPESHFDHPDARRLDPDVALTKHLDQSYVVMGNVAYPTSRLRQFGINGSVIARVPVGAVNFPPSRDALRYTPLTDSTLETIKSFVNERLQHVAQADVESQTTPVDALNCMGKWTRISSKAKTSYRGKTPPDYVKMGDWGFSYSPRHDIGGKFGKDARPMLHSLTSENAVFVLGYPNRTFTKIHKAKLTEYVSRPDNDLDAGSKYFIGEKLPESYWLHGVEVVQWSEMRDIKVAPSTEGRERRDPTWEVVQENGHIDEVNELNITGKVIIVSGTNMHHRGRTAKTAFPDAPVVLLHPNRVEKFQRENKGAINVEDAAIIEAKRFLPRLSELEMEVLAVGGGTARILDGLDPDAILDPLLARFTRTVADVKGKKLHSKMDAINRIVDYFQRIRLDQGRSGRTEEHITKMYPLLGHLVRNVDENYIIQYVNALYRTRQGAKAA